MSFIRDATVLAHMETRGKSLIDFYAGMFCTPQPDENKLNELYANLRNATNESLIKEGCFAKAPIECLVESRNYKIFEKGNTVLPEDVDRFMKLCNFLCFEEKRQEQSKNCPTAAYFFDTISTESILQIMDDLNVKGAEEWSKHEDASHDTVVVEQNVIDKLVLTQKYFERFLIPPEILNSYRKLYMSVFNSEFQHYYAVIVDLIDRQIFVYDSYSKLYKPAALKVITKIQQQAAQFIADWLYMNVTISAAEVTLITAPEFNIVFDSELFSNQSNNGNDCAFAVMALAYHMAMDLPPIYDSSFITNFRCCAAYMLLPMPDSNNQIIAEHNNVSVSGEMLNCLANMTMTENSAAEIN